MKMRHVAIHISLKRGECKFTAFEAEMNFIERRFHMENLYFCNFYWFYL